MKSTINLILAFVVIPGSILTSCKKTETNLSASTNEMPGNSVLQDSVYKGAKVKVFGGKAWVWVKLVGNVPEQLAITLTNSVLTRVPADSGSESEIVIPAPSQGNITAFHAFAVDWSAHGHAPQGIYSVPLFDNHFYTITESERQAILNDPDYDQHFANYPSQDYIPGGYGLINAGGIPGGGCITGVHWYYLNGPEFNNKKFKQTFVYGSYNGEVDFYDPMMTLQFLKNVQSFERNIPQPSKFRTNGYYPTKLAVLKHDGVTDIIFENFVLRPAS